MHRSPSIGRPAHVRRRTVRGWTALLLTAVASLSGCYVHQPLAGAPSPGSTVVLDLNDRGRLALGDSIGPSATTIQGEIATSSDSSYVLRVESVQYLNGQFNRWSGEQLAVRSDFIGRARERQLSRKRTWALGLGVVAAIVGVALTTDLFGQGSIGRAPGPGPLPPAQ